LQTQRLGEMHFLWSDDTDRFHSFRHLTKTGRLDGVGKARRRKTCARLTTSLAAFIVNRGNFRWFARPQSSQQIGAY